MSEPAKRRGRPPKALEDRAAETIHVRFTTAEIEAIDAYLVRQRKTAGLFHETITRTALIRGLVLAEIGLATSGRRRASAPKPK